MANKTHTSAGFWYVFVILLLHTIGFFYPSNITWGFHFTGFLIPVIFIAFIILVLAIAIQIMKHGIPSIIIKAGEFMRLYPKYFLISSLGSFVAFGILLRVATPLLGDGFFLVKNFSETLQNIDTIYPRNEPLSTFYYFSFMTLLRVVTFQDFMNAFLIADLLLGIIFITCVFYTVRELISDNTDRVLAFIFITTLPYMQLFFGYVETYAAILAMLSLFLLVSILCIREKSSFIIAPAAALIMTLTHYLAILFTPALIYLSAVIWKKKGSKPILKGYALGVLIFIIFLAMTNFDLTRFNENVPYSHFVPLNLSNDPVEAYSEVYTLFSLHHGIDLLNFFIFLCAPSLFLILFILLKKSEKNPLSAEGKLLAIGLIPVLTFYLIVKFDIGAAKDWDVFAPYTLAAGFLALTLFFPLSSDEKKRIFLIITMVSFLHSMTFFILNASREPSLKRYEAFFNNNTLSNFGFYSASLGLSLYHHQMKNRSGVIDVWERYINHYPKDGRGYINIITNLKSFGIDSIARIEFNYRRWLRSIPNDSIGTDSYAGFSLDLGNYYFNQNRFPEARENYLKAIILNPEFERAYNNLGSLYAQEGKLDTAKVLFERAVKLDTNYAEAYYNLGSLYEDLKNRKDAFRYYKKASELGNPSAVEKLKTIKAP